MGQARRGGLARQVCTEWEATCSCHSSCQPSVLVGNLLIASRSATEVASEARKNSWSTFKDGWIADFRKKTFQKGLTTLRNLLPIPESEFEIKGIHPE